MRATVPMAVGALAPDKEEPWQQVGPKGKPIPDLAALQNQLADLKKQLVAGFAGVGIGKGDTNTGGQGGGKGNPPKKLECFKCGGNHYARDCPKGGKGGKKGDFKGGKGPRPARPGWGVCRDFARTGRCPRLQQFGHCKFAHVRLDGKLAAVDGLVFEDISDAARYDNHQECFVIPDGATVKPDLADIVAAELAELCGHCSEDGSHTPLLGQSSPF